MVACALGLGDHLFDYFAILDMNKWRTCLKRYFAGKLTCALQRFNHCIDIIGLRKFFIWHELYLFDQELLGCHQCYQKEPSDQLNLYRLY